MGGPTKYYNYSNENIIQIFSKINKGKFLLRIEDTDRERWNKEAETAIFEGLSWLGIEPDIAPISQYSRKNRHLEVATEMVKKRTAYRSNLSQEEKNKYIEQEDKRDKNKIFWLIPLMLFLVVFRINRSESVFEVINQNWADVAIISIGLILIVYIWRRQTE